MGGDGGGREGVDLVRLLSRDVDDGTARVDGGARKGHVVSVCRVERVAAMHADLVEAVGGVRHAYAARDR
eukprot:scaffold45714_cov69-Phaeocystis_antarctica.AAC.2